MCFVCKVFCSSHGRGHQMLSSKNPWKKKKTVTANYPEPYITCMLIYWGLCHPFMLEPVHLWECWLHNTPVVGGAILWNRKPALVQRELRSLVTWRKHLLEILARLTCQGVWKVKTRTQWQWLFCLLLSDHKQPHSHSKWPVVHISCQLCSSVLCLLRVSVMSSVCKWGGIVDLPEQEEECQLSVSDLLNSLHSVGYLWVW